MPIDEKTRDSYFSWKPEEDPEFAPMIYGRGTIGGKGRSLLFAIRMLRECGDAHLSRVCLPESIYFSTEMFHRFIESVPSLEGLISADDPNALERAFLLTPLPGEVTQAIKKFLSNINDPVVVRSSSMLEDSVKYSFAGKYLSTFFGNNTGGVDERTARVESEIKKIYARIYFPQAVSYKKRHGLGDDEMGIIVMRITGRWCGSFYYPTLGGVGYSKNYRRWTTRVRQEDGVLRLVFGLATMSTKRGYARTVSLTNPTLRPEGQNPDKVAFHAQEKFHVISWSNPDELTVVDVNKNWRQLLDNHADYEAFAQLYHREFESDMFMSVPKNMKVMSPDSKICFTFENFPKKYPKFFERMKMMLDLLENSMGVPADIEYAGEPADEQLYLIQSRPLWNNDCQENIIPPLEGKHVLLQADRMVTHGAAEHIKVIVYVDHHLYYTSPNFYTVARRLGEVNSALAGEPYILVSPGRIGSSNPELGVPVQYDEITNCCCIVELGLPRFGYMPELSYGTHFFSDLEADNVLYMPVFDGEGRNIYDREWFKDAGWEQGPDPSIRIYRGDFSAYMDSQANRGVIIENISS